jgi:hypothetical protein
MKKYFVLYRASPEQFKKWMSATPEQQKKGMEAWGAWMQTHKGDIVDQGSPLSKVKRVTPKAVEDSHNDIGGYMVIQAESLDAAAQMMKDSPHFESADDVEGGGFVEVMEMPEMKM